jgi:hypothetical protein
MLPEETATQEDKEVDRKATLISEHQNGLQSTQPLWKRRRKVKNKEPNLSSGVKLIIIQQSASSSDDELCIHISLLILHSEK